MAEYILLTVPTGNRRPRSSAKSLGASQERAAAINLRKVELDAADAQEAATAPGAFVARRMPTSLIRPLVSSSGVSESSWGVTAVQADRSLYDGAGVKVAVLDTGVDAGHPAFDHVRILEKDFSGSGDGDRNGHGTHCAGTVFGGDVDGHRIGIARGVRQALAGKILDDQGRGGSFEMVSGVRWAIEGGADVISMSVGIDFPGFVAELQGQGLPPELAASEALTAFAENLRLFDLLRGEANLTIFRSPPLLVGAAGNESRRDLRPDFRISPSLPSSALHLTVGALARHGTGYRVADFSNGPAKLAAPGVDIVSAAPGGGLASMSGTSMACPHVAGVAALWASKLRSEGEQISAESLMSHLLASAQRVQLSGSPGAADAGRGLVTAPV